MRVLITKNGTNYLKNPRPKYRNTRHRPTVKRPTLPITATTQERVEHNRKYATPSEIKLKDFLSKNGINFIFQHPLISYIVDFYLPDNKIVIELDGIQHGYLETREKDIKRDATLNDYGYKVLRYKNDTVFYTPEKILQDIKK